jgi:hypothetical protein
MRPILLALGLLAVAPLASAGEVRLGVVHLTDAPDRDVLVLPPCESSANKAVSRLKVAVEERSADIRDLDVWFHNGDHQNLEVREVFQAGSTSRWIDMAGDARCIKKIKIMGDTNTPRRGGKQARVTFFGDAPGVDRPEALEEGIILGRMHLTDALDRDVVDLPPCDDSANRPVTRIRAKVRLYPAQVDRLRVVFQNGEDAELQVNEHFAAGHLSRWLDLPGEARCIDKIILVGDTDSIGRRPGKQAEIVFIGD